MAKMVRADGTTFDQDVPGYALSVTMYERSPIVTSVAEFDDADHHPLTGLTCVEYDLRDDGAYYERSREAVRGKSLREKLRDHFARR